MGAGVGRGAHFLAAAETWVESYYPKQLDTRRISGEITNSHVRPWRHHTQRSPKRSLVVRFYKPHTPPFLFLVLNWRLGLSAANNCNKTLNTLSRWHAPSSGTFANECGWVSVDCPHRIHYVGLTLTCRTAGSSLELRPRELRVQASGKGLRGTRRRVAADTSQDAFRGAFWLFPYWSRYLCSAVWTEKLSRGLPRASAKVSTEIFLSC